MENILFLAAMVLAIAVVYGWGFTRLPGERWQIMASVPRLKAGSHWEALNITWYGCIVACACAAGAGLTIVLLGSVGIPLGFTTIFCLAVLAVCLPGSRLIARIVEGKRHTATVGGAMFLGLLMAPLLLWVSGRILPARMGTQVPAIVILACMAVTYTLGEGIGRLACISFGCCYGKPVANLPAWLRTVFEPLGVTFRGPTKKIAYAHGLDGVKVVPIQAVTAVIHAVAALAGVWLFLEGAYGAAFLSALVVTQVWRVASEFLRADFRGSLSLSAYQVMAALAVVIAIVVVSLYNAPFRVPHIVDGLSMLWHPLALLFLQGLWLAVFYSSGRSSVTGARVSLHVIHERI
ncbi:MAG TPA: prolipoprotein diacylglyceryl transferase [Deltaproteobacteria bacterium]|nr:prolipoprotein diacylglyceryl transferase [Deltaproteobacteria bacterium]